MGIESSLSDQRRKALIVVIIPNAASRSYVFERLRRDGFMVLEAREIEAIAHIWKVIKPDAVVADREASAAIARSLPEGVPWLVYSPGVPPSSVRVLDGARRFHDPSELERLNRALRYVCR